MDEDTLVDERLFDLVVKLCLDDGSDTIDYRRMAEHWEKVYATGDLLYRTGVLKDGMSWEEKERLFCLYWEQAHGLG